jgi:small conductance mechanosensitive channel
MAAWTLRLALCGVWLAGWAAPGWAAQVPGVPAAAQGGEPAPADKPAEGEQNKPPGTMEKVENLLEDAPLDPASWKQVWRTVRRAAVAKVPSLLVALITMLVFLLLYLFMSAVLKRVFSRSAADPALQYLVLRLTWYVLLILGLITAASQLGFQITTLLAGVSVLGLAVGLAAQETLANLIAGFTILWDRPFRTGDRVTIADTYGTVLRIGLRSTRIRTLEQNDAVLPNIDVINHLIMNHTQNPQLRLSVPLGIAYKEDTREARRVLLAAVDGHPLLAESPKPDVVVTALADSSVNLDLRVWLKDPHREREALWTMIELSKIALDEAGIEIPFPQRTLHLGDARLVRALRQWSEAGSEAREAQGELPAAPTSLPSPDADAAPEPAATRSPKPSDG